ncbi:dehydratase [Salarchaeum japonicum]|uniref:dehydratase n=1 Tax=Salarchaeum japonicum TaxID=555573 RepID=UPI003C70DCA6
MDVSLPPEEEDVYTYERTFTTDEVEAFAELSHDDQPVHSVPDEAGRLMVQGLLTATLPTAIGSALGVLAYHMDNYFHKPVYTGQPITCETTLTDVEERDDRFDIRGENRCTNDQDEEVLTGSFEGVVWKE